MFKKYYNKMMGKEEYSVKLPEIPVKFQGTLLKLKNHYNKAEYDRLVTDVESLLDKQKQNTALKDRAANTANFLAYVKKTLVQKK